MRQAGGVRKRSSSVTVRSGQFEFQKLNSGESDWRDAYHWILSLSWPRFVALITGVYLAINIFFAALYSFSSTCIAGGQTGTFVDDFFFSVQTLATVGYGHTYPATLYGNLISTGEIIVGMFLVAVITGLVFVRFSRPAARIEFSNTIVISSFDGVPTLMIRVANLRHHSMVEAEFKIMFMRDQWIREGEAFRHFYTLKLHFDKLIVFPTALTLRHTIDEQSPLYGLTLDDLRDNDARLVASVVCIETVIPAAVQSQRDYSWREVRFGEKFVEIYHTIGDGQLSVDYGRLHETEPAPLSL